MVNIVAMRISGFSMARNATKLYYPFAEAIRSILPLVDEFVVAIGEGDEDDNTRALIEAIDSDKIRIIDTVWDLEVYPNGMENAHQTDIAKQACSGDWLIYVQADEVVHEKYLPVIRKRCEELLDDSEVEGLLFKYIHFWGDYGHHQNAHGWYPHEIRVVRNHPEIHSWKSAQSFRRIPDFDGVNYRVKAGTHKLKVAAVDAYIYHYGWVRPPDFMMRKSRALDTIHKGQERVEELYKERTKLFDYGPIGRAAEFKGTHPEVMRERIAAMDWTDQLNYSSNELNPNRPPYKHDLLKNRILTWIEQNLLGGKQIGGAKNYVLLDR